MKYRDTLLFTGVEHDRLLYGAIEAAENLVRLGETPVEKVTDNAVTHVTMLMGRKMGAYAKYRLSTKYRHLSKGRGHVTIQN